MRWIVRAVVVVALVGLGWLIWSRLADEGGGGKTQRSPAAVSVAPVEQRSIAERRIFSGSLEASARFVVAPKVGGRVASLAVDLGDTVERGQVVATLDDAEFVQAVEAAKAELGVAEAQVAEARAEAQVAGKEQRRVSSLSNKGVLSASQRDQIEAEAAMADAAVRVARARVQAAQAALAAARVRLGYTQVTADWPEGEGEGTRVVADREVDAGETVAANAPLMTIVDLRPLTGVIYVTEADYARLRVDQDVTLRTDVWPGRTFTGRIARIAPVFREASRQARVELSVQNAEGALKPGMFVRATTTLDAVDDATVVPVSALAVRDGVEGVFVVDGEVAKGSEAAVKWQPVERGIVAEERVQLRDPLSGHVVTLGQQLVEDGSRVTIAALGAASVEEEAGERALDERAGEPR